MKLPLEKVKAMILYFAAQTDPKFFGKTKNLLNNVLIMMTAIVRILQILPMILKAQGIHRKQHLPFLTLQMLRFQKHMALSALMILL
jgi:hypothetical protein